MRTFIAVELPLAIRNHLAAVQRQLQAKVRRTTAIACFNWVAPEKTHITLRFLGETTPQQAEQLQQGLTSLVAAQRPFSLTLQEVGAFPNFRRPNVLWVGLGGALVPLQQLQQRIETFVQQLGFSPEERRFTPHLTIARAQRQSAAAALGAAGRIIESSRAVVTPGNPEPPHFTVAQIVHIQSELRPEGARYTPLCHFMLKSNEASGK